MDESGTHTGLSESRVPRKYSCSLVVRAAGRLRTTGESGRGGSRGDLSLRSLLLLSTAAEAPSTRYSDEDSRNVEQEAENTAQGQGRSPWRDSATRKVQGDSAEV
jgi:hypothetical protein